MVGYRGLLASMLLVVTPPVAPPNIPSLVTPPEVAPTTLPAARDIASRMTVGVFVNGQGPFAFAIDTGASRSVIARSLADRLALPIGRSALMHGMAGQGMIDTVRIDRLGVGHTEVSGVDAPVIADGNLGVPGLLGIDGLADQRIVMDFEKGMMRIEPSQRYEPLEANTIVVRGQRRFGQLILADADVNGQHLLVIVDSGSQVSIGNAALRARLTHGGTDRFTGRTELQDVAGRKLSVDYGTLSQVRIGGIRILNVPIVFGDAHPFQMFGLSRQPAMLLGMDILRSFRKVSVDFGNKRVRFRANEIE